MTNNIEEVDLGEERPIVKLEMRVTVDWNLLS